jgi:hypothetical protein
MTHGPNDILELIFTHTGQAELRAFKDPDEDGDGDLVWSSDSDLDFKDKVSDDVLSADKDSERILVHLRDSGVLEADELGDVDIFEEAEEATAGDPDDDEFEDDEDDDDEDNDN